MVEVFLKPGEIATVVVHAPGQEPVVLRRPGQPDVPTVIAKVREHVNANPDDGWLTEHHVWITVEAFARIAPEIPYHFMLRPWLWSEEEGAFTVRHPTGLKGCWREYLVLRRDGLPWGTT